MTKEELTKRLGKGTLILDGATGSNLMKAGMPKGICTEQWVAEHPKAIIELQKAYAEAGSDIVYAPTFMANPISLATHGLAAETERLNHTLVGLSRKAVGDQVLVAGDLTTTGKLMEPLGPMKYEDLYESYKKQISCLAEAGVDLLVAETMLASNETLVILDAAQAVKQVQDHTGRYIACLEEIAYLRGYIGEDDLHRLAGKLGQTLYGQYLMCL